MILGWAWLGIGIGFGILGLGLKAWGLRLGLRVGDLCLEVGIRSAGILGLGLGADFGVWGLTLGFG